MTPDQDARYRRLRGLWGFAGALAWVITGIFALLWLGASPAYLFLVVLAAPLAFAIGAYFARSSLSAEFRAARPDRPGNEERAHREEQQRQEKEERRADNEKRCREAIGDFRSRLRTVGVALDKLPTIDQSRRPGLLAAISAELGILASYDQGLIVEIMSDESLLTDLATVLTRLRDISSLSPEALILKEAVRRAAKTVNQ